MSCLIYNYCQFGIFFDFNIQILFSFVGYEITNSIIFFSSILSLMNAGILLLIIFVTMKDITSFFFQENYAAISDKLYSENFMSSCLFINT
jgi:hypothetical protein